HGDRHQRVYNETFLLERLGDRVFQIVGHHAFTLDALLEHGQADHPVHAHTYAAGQLRRPVYLNHNQVARPDFLGRKIGRSLRAENHTPLSCPQGSAKREKKDEFHGRCPKVVQYLWCEPSPLPAFSMSRWHLSLTSYLSGALRISCIPGPDGIRKKVNSKWDRPSPCAVCHG